MLQVPTFKMHLYTLIQLAGICLLYAVKSSRFSLALPFFLVMMVPLRIALGYLFTPLQLRAVSLTFSNKNYYNFFKCTQKTVQRANLIIININSIICSSISRSSTCVLRKTNSFILCYLSGTTGALPPGRCDYICVYINVVLEMVI